MSRKRASNLTAGMYLDYCTGLSVDEVAEKWGYSSAAAVYRRFKALKLPLRLRACHCGFLAGRNPHDISGTTFEDANRRRTLAASAFMVERAREALPYATSEYQRGILQLRIDHPDRTLAELAALHDPPLTKDAVSSVLRRARR